jgi:hypothetical protein
VNGGLFLQTRVHRDAVLDDGPPGDDGVPHRDRAAAQPRRDRVRQRAGDGHPAAGDLAAGVVHGGQQLGAVHQQVGGLHGDASCPPVSR